MVLPGVLDLSAFCPQVQSGYSPASGRPWCYVDVVTTRIDQKDAIRGLLHQAIYSEPRSCSGLLRASLRFVISTKVAWLTGVPSGS